MQVVLASVGSLGDIHPFIAIGRALRQRGHRVTLICNDDFAAEVSRSGIDFASAGAAVSLDAATTNPNLWHPIKGLGVFWRTMLAPSITPTFQHIQRLAADERCVVVAPPAMFGARFARELPGVRLISAYTAPALLRSDRAPLTMAHWRLPAATPSALVRMAWQALDRHKLHPMALATLQRHAGELGRIAPPAGVSIFGEWMHSPDGGVTLFPEWFAPARNGWPCKLHFGSFPLYGGDVSDGLPAQVQAFLDAHEAPVVFMPGSAMRHAEAFFETAVQTCSALGLSAILLTTRPHQLPARLPATIIHMPYLPFTALLPHARSLVHHGGIGSCAQALRAGIPQLVMPMAHDQFDNAECLRRLGIGAELRRPLFDARHLSRALERLQTIPKTRLQAYRDRLSEPGLERICERIEAMA